MAPLGPALLFCPADRPDRYAKALERSDTVVFDLEDAVAPEGKDAARRELETFLGEHPDSGSIVRVNAADSRWFAADLAMLRGVDHTSIMLPKATGADDLRDVGDHEVVALCETARGLLGAPAIAEHPACRALMWGGEDLVADLGGRRSRNPSGRYHAVVEQARSTVLLAARAAGKDAVDSVHIDISDLEGLERESREAVDVGFAAKACIHPSHIDVIRSAFAVPPETLAWARGVVEAAASASGVFRYEGRMIDEPLLRHARTVLHRVDGGSG